MELATREPIELVGLAEQIKNDLEKIERSAAEWAEANYSLCVHLYQARKKHNSNKAFGAWLAENDLDRINDHDRAAAIAMGEHPDECRSLLEKTDRRSLQLIHREEFQVASGSKIETAKPSKPPKRAPKKKKTPSPEAEKVAQLAREGRGRTEIAATLGVGEHVAQLAVKHEEGRRSGIEEAKQQALDEAAMNAELAASDKEKLKQAIDAHKRKLDREYDLTVKKLECEIDARVRERASKLESDIKARWDQIYLPNYEEGQRRAQLYRDAYKGVFSKQEFQFLLKCLHPDQRPESDKLNEAFSLFNSRKTLLYNEALVERPIDPLLPKTVAEMMARKKTKTV